MKKLFLISTLLVISSSVVFGAEKGSIKIKKRSKEPQAT